MSKLPILTYGSEVLKQIAQPVTEIDDEVRSLIKDMAETMFAAPGVGLAAPQVGVSKRIVVVCSPEEYEERVYFTLINPEIVHMEGKMISEEGCLSVPGDHREEVDRADRVRVKGLDDQGHPIEIEGIGLMARILQHEIDHLNGLLYIDRLSPAKRDVLRRKMKKKQT